MLNPRAYYAALLAAVLLAAAFVTPLIVSKGSAITGTDAETTCIQDRDELRALAIMYKQSILDELRVLGNAVEPVTKTIIESQNPSNELNKALDELADKYWVDAARFLLYTYKLYYVAHRYYECTGDAFNATEIIVEVLYNRPVSKVSGSTVAQIANTIKTLNTNETLAEVKILKEAIRTGNRLAIDEQVKSVISYVLLVKLREVLSSQAQYPQ
ncbi:hypothetical protein PYJP_00050 [Pyrofollis japonicus]|uniref:hypothetical protein n=1 Tax=Pyrofollis japonicus TaxID=3060460 RepID=UPI00295B4EBA|nr:hypothetical protein [Pyrofollis japonicus]BEP16653.1 hypothetical protein PYJP_00050 [Pyrofollis japonicus]